MNTQEFMQELFSSLSGYDRSILEKLYKVFSEHDYIELNLDRFTFEKEKDIIMISDDVHYHDIGSVELGKDEFLRELAGLIRH